MRMLLLLSLIVCAIGLSAAGCSNSVPDVEQSLDSKPLRRGNVEDPATLDPALAEDVHTFNILIDLYEGLVGEDATGRIVPGVAKSWSISDDGLTYTFSLRSTARWSNDAPVTAHDFVRGLRRVSAPSTHSAYADLLRPIENFAAVKRGTAQGQQLGVLATDDQTVVIQLSKASPHFLSVLAMPISFPLSGDGLNPAQFEQPDEFVGNGAYVLTYRQIGSPVRLTRNSKYWDSDSVQIESIEYIAVADENTEFNMYRAAELDITAVIPSSQIVAARESFSDEIYIAPALALYYLAFDLTEPSLSNVELRKALSISIDREQLVSILGRGEQPAYGIVPPGVAAYDGVEFLWGESSQIQKMELARKHYSNAGYSTDNPFKLKYVYDAGGIHEQVALIVGAMWKDVLGVEVELEKREWKYFLETRDAREEWQIMRFSWFGDYNDASTFTDIFLSDSEQNLPRYRNPEYDALIDSAASEPDRDSRAAILASAEKILLDEYPIAPLYFYVSKHLVRSEIHGFENNILDRHPSRYLYREVAQD